MELIYFELKARSTPNYLGFLVVLLVSVILVGVMSFSRDVPTKAVAGLFAALFAFVCCGYIYSFAMNLKSAFGIRDNMIWWDSPGWWRAVGTVAIDEIRCVRILEGPTKLQLIMQDGTSRRIPCNAVWNLGRAEELRDVLVANYPHIDVELIEGAG
jgi:hypothetical protein